MRFGGGSGGRREGIYFIVAFDKGVYWFLLFLFFVCFKD